MTTPDIAGLCERLRKPLDYTLHLYECDVDTTMSNAADTLERQAAEIKRLREALHFYVDHHDYPNAGPWGINSDDFGDRARAALTGDS